MSYFKVIDIERFLQEQLKTVVDLIPRDSLHALLRDEVVASARQVY